MGDQTKRNVKTRTPRACDLCKRRKIRCHFTPGQPCFNCIAYEVDCVFTEDSRKRGPPKGRAEQLEKRIAEVNEKLKDLSGRSDIDALLDEHDHNRCKKRPRNKPTVKDRQSVLSREFTENIDALHSRLWPPGARYNDIIYLGDMDTFQIFSKKLRLKDDGTNKWKGHFIRKYGDTVVLVADEANAGKTDTKIPKFKWKWNTFVPSLRGIHQYVYLVTGLDQYTSTRLLKIYFANIHPILPVIDKHEFLQQYRDKLPTYPTADLINAMFGAAARFVECENLDQERKQRLPPDATWDLPIGWSDHFFDQAQKIISDGILGPATISTVQAIVLIQNQRATVDTKSSACWLTGGFAVRLAQGLGLNRNCDAWDIPEHDKETRKRTWWALYICDRFQGALNGRPLAIDDDDNDVGYPDCRADYEEIVDAPDDPDEYSGPRFPSFYTRPEPTDGRVCVYQLFVELAKLSSILGRVIHGLHTPEAKMLSVQQGSDETVRKLDRELTEWRFAFGRNVKHTTFPDYRDNGEFTGVVATTLLFYFTTLILLHRPFIRSNVSNAAGSKQSSFSSFWICTSAATNGIRIASELSIHDYLLTPYAFSLYPVLQCCLILMYNTKNQDPHISIAAKEDLEKGIGLVDRIHEASSTSQTLKVLLHSIMDNKNIDTITGPLEMDYKDLDESKRGENRYGNPSSYTCRAKQKKTTTKVSISALIDNLLLQDIPVDSSWVSRASTPVSIPLQSTQEEAFTLQQFGLNSVPSDTILPLTQGEMYPPQIPFAATASLPLMTTLPAGETAALPIDQALALQSNNIFQSDPDNPFWSIPSSINWTEWHEWYQHSQDSSAWHSLNG
ncbi:fungal-specific transcription factor domain-containing protein [Fennellomyces sp. T-0311]|nr:fungal-specific transcription factor domain-containing protein [Fennellomyces sp. T-0311]